MTNQELGYVIAGALFLLLAIVFLIALITNRERTPKKHKKITKDINNCNPTQFKKTQQYQQSYEWLPYRLKGSVMTNREKIMYIVLDEYCKKNKLVLLSKVRIADFIEPIHTNNRRNFYYWFNRISAKHIDFLICDSESFVPKLAIELDDSTHKYKSRQERDIFVDNVYNSVKLPIMHFWNVDGESVKNKLNEFFGIHEETIKNIK